ncbi:hypothetical protein [Myxococcus sp. Y35]|uniref:hypothetical protein n=1 Tax=Pseudomyxococcus flavus TaxID=3115648 RepID=UPI003CF483EC
MIRYGLTVASLVMAALGAGCTSVSHTQTADTLGAGRYQIAIEPGLGGAAGFGEDGSVEGGVYPHFDLALRYGASERVDLGFRFGSSLVEFQSKFLLTQPNDPLKAISLAPSVSGAFMDGTWDDGEELSTNYVNLAVPLLVGFKTEGGSELVLGPRVLWTHFSGDVGNDGTSVNIFSVGASVGYAFRVTESFRLMPEVGFSYPVLGTVDSSTNDSIAFKGFNTGIAQLKLGFLFGGGRPIRRGPDILPAH